MVGIKDRIASFLKEVSDRQTKDLLKEVLLALDKPYDLEWLRDEFKLSPAEYRVITLLAEGKTPAAISQITGTQIQTVRRQSHNAYNKMGVRNMAELTALLLKRATYNG